MCFSKLSLLSGITRPIERNNRTYMGETLACMYATLQMNCWLSSSDQLFMHEKKLYYLSLPEYQVLKHVHPLLLEGPLMHKIRVILNLEIGTSVTVLSAGKFSKQQQVNKSMS